MRRSALLAASAALLEEIETGARTANLERDPPVLSLDAGAVYWDTIFGSLAVGLVSGATSGNDAILSHLPYVTNSWGLTVMTN